MKIAILSDIHDNVWSLEDALQEIEEVDALIGCGDYCSPFVIGQLAGGFSGPIHLVMGNNDGDLFRIMRVAAQYDQVHFHGELFEAELGGKFIAANHYANIARSLSQSGRYDVVCYGHNHSYQVERVGKTLSVNPGPVMGYDPVSKQNVPSTYVIYDTTEDEAARCEV